ncbi:SHOCT domain-containing protein [Nocardioides sp. BP30]|uniref:SHOCT domain-containing protein n=1 Tax=Nocardioides sp. BP30 TaxID=3036374 RepID=UPI002468F0D2|nr:SHOCT domain-containing protein [Nocardioides sp. BP30]WGL52383.1 SHOCT domain-containing protein [Nocardioides sp. BP30]
MAPVTPLLTNGQYPLLDVFWTMMWLFLWILWIFLLVRILSDVFRSNDLGGWGKALWTIFLIVLPYLGVLVYLIARGGSMHRREAQRAEDADELMRAYVRSAAGTSASTADELSKLADLRERGVLTDAEYDAQKTKLLRA